MLKSAVVSAILAPLIVPGRRASAQQSPSPVILEVRIGDIASRTMEARRVGGIALLPLSEVMDLVEMPEVAGNEYVAADSLSILLHAPVSVDWDDLSVTISDDGSTPVSRRAARRRELVRTHYRTADGDVVSIQPRMWPDNVVLDYVFANESRSFRGTPTSIVARMGAALLRGSLETEARLIRNGRPEVSTAWARQLSRGSAIRTIRLGAVNLPFRAAIAKGILLSSDAVDGSAAQRSISVHGRFAPGWEVDILQNDLLVYSGTADSSGDVTTSVPSATGASLLRLRGYGPRDERIEFQRYVLVTQDLLPPHSHSISIAAGTCQRLLCDRAVAFSGRYAPLAALTLGGTVEGRLQAGRYSVIPAALVAVRASDDLTGEVQVGRESNGAKFRYSPAPSFDLGGSYLGRRLAERTAVPGVASLTGYFVWRNSSGLSLDGTYETRQSTILRTDELRIGTFASSGSAFVRPVVRFSRASAKASVGFEIGGTADIRLPIPAIHARLRLGLADLRSGTQSVSFLASASNIQLTLAAQRNRMAEPIRVEATLNALTFAGRIFSRVAPAGPLTTASHTIAGSFSVSRSPRRGISHSEIARTGRSFIHGVVYLDNNGNGIQDASEDYLPDVLLQVGSVTLSSDSVGSYFVEVPPFAPILVRVERENLPDDLVPAAAVRVEPVPNSVTRIDVPLRRRIVSTASRGSVN